MVTRDAESRTTGAPVNARAYGEHIIGFAPAGSSHEDDRLADRAAAGVLLLSPLLAITLLLHQPTSPDVPVVVALGGVAVFAAVLLLIFDRLGWANLTIA